MPLEGFLILIFEIVPVKKGGRGRQGPLLGNQSLSPVTAGLSTNIPD
jgi:hypothetical protein